MAVARDSSIAYAAERHAAVPTWQRLGAVAGLVFAVLFVAGMFTMGSPDSSAEQDVISFYSDSGNRAMILIGVYLMAVAGVCFLWFLSSLRRVLRQALDGAEVFADVALAGGVAFVVLLYGAAAATGTGPATVAFGGEDLYSADVLRMLPQLGYGLLLLFGMFAAIALISATSVAVLRSASMPSWLGWLGIVCAVVLLGGVAFLPMFALPVWVIATSIVLLRRADLSQAA